MLLLLRHVLEEEEEEEEEEKAEEKNEKKKEKKKEKEQKEEEEKHEDTTDHLTSGCPILAKNKYLMRHDKVCTHLHYSICKALGIETADKWYTHMPNQCMKREMSQCCGIKQYT